MSLFITKSAVLFATQHSVWHVNIPIPLRAWFLSEACTLGCSSTNNLHFTEWAFGGDMAARGSRGSLTPCPCLKRWDAAHPASKPCSTSAPLRPAKSMTGQIYTANDTHVAKYISSAGIDWSVDLPRVVIRMCLPCQSPQALHCSPQNSRDLAHLQIASNAH